LQEILQTARRNQVTVVVPNEAMLDMGASISMATEAEDIAATIAGIIRKIQSDGLQSVRPVTPLSAIRVVTRDSDQVVRQ
jgi:2-phospho-L-lactate guanylyltransferase (CobY/MobA/RfbA family)